MRICPRCRTVYSSPSMRECPRDQAALVDARKFAEQEGDPLVGQEVAGRYRIMARIGTGGMGAVYAAEQMGLQRAVALKILKKELIWDHDTVARFHREAKAMSLLTHPNTVRVFDFGETGDGLLFLAMELLEGEMLTAKLDREGALDVREAIVVVQQILRSLAEAHTKGIIHRDLKPDNIYLTRIEAQALPMVKVLDFGIAKVIQGDRLVDQLETQAGTVFGTPRYMSPEQAQGKPLDPRSDLYSVAVLLYQLLTGRPPFVDDDAVVVMAKHIREKPDAPTVAAPDRPIPASLEKLLMRALEKEPNKRFASAARLDAKLEACLPDVIAEMRAREQGRRSSLMNAKVGTIPVLPLAIGGVLVAIALGFTSYLITSSSEADTPPPPPVAQRPAAPPPPPARPAPRLATVKLRSDPPNATIRGENGDVLGLTPYQLDIEVGATRLVGVEREGYDPQTIELSSDQPETSVVLLASAEPEEAPTAVSQRPPGTTRRIRRPPRRGQRGNAQTSAGNDVVTPPPRHNDPYDRFD